VFYPEDVYKRLPKVPKEGIDAAINMLVGQEWIAYERPVLWIIKGFKNEPFRAPNNQKQITGVVAILKSLPKLKIVSDFADYYKITLNKGPKEDQKKIDKKADLCSFTGCGKLSTITIMGRGYCDEPNHRDEAFK